MACRGEYHDKDHCHRIISQVPRCCAQVRWLHGFSEGDVPSAIAVPPSPGPGLPYLGILEPPGCRGL